MAGSKARKARNQFVVVAPFLNSVISSYPKYISTCSVSNLGKRYWKGSVLRGLCMMLKVGLLFYMLPLNFVDDMMLKSSIKVVKKMYVQNGRKQS